MGSVLGAVVCSRHHPPVRSAQGVLESWSLCLVTVVTRTYMIISLVPIESRDFKAGNSYGLSRFVFIHQLGDLRDNSGNDNVDMDS